MRLLIVGGLQGQIGLATKIAMDKGAKVTHAGDIEQALASLRGGVGADLVFCDVGLDISGLVRGLAAERIWLSLERRMHCADGLCGHCYLGASYVCRDGPTYRYDHYLRLLRGSGADALPAAPGYC